MVVPGVYRDISYDEYASWPAVRASTLNKCARSMAHGRQAEIDPRSDTDALAFGTAVHTAILEPERFASEYVVVPRIDRRTKKGRNEWETFTEESTGKTPITEDEYELCKKMITAVHVGHLEAAELMANAKAKELSFLWIDEETGLSCKGRVDLLTTFAGWTMIVDVKSTIDASRHAFQRQMTSFGYYRALAWYRLGLATLAPAERRCVLLAIEKTPPHCVVPYELDETAIEVGEREMRALLRRYAECRLSGLWPGYSSSIAVLSLPAWKVKEHEHELNDAA